MTRALWLAAWVFGVAGWVGLVMFWLPLFVTAAILSAAAVLAWGFRVHPDPDEWTTGEWWLEETEETGGEQVMAYEFESDEWARANRQQSETDRAATAVAVRQSAGMCGDLDDVRSEMGSYR